MPVLTKDQLPLNSMQSRFVSEYLFDRSQRKAAIRAGYSIDSADQQGCRLMADLRVQAAIKEAEVKLSDVTGITPERILQELAKIGFANVGDVVDIQTGEILPDVSRDSTAAISEISTETRQGVVTTKKIKVKMSDKVSALEKMGKHLGMFKDHLEVSGSLNLIDLIEQSFEKKEEPSSD